jgi:hypothetical protein
MFTHTHRGLRWQLKRLLPSPGVGRRHRPEQWVRPLFLGDCGIVTRVGSRVPPDYVGGSAAPRGVGYTSSEWIRRSLKKASNDELN